MMDVKRHVDIIRVNPEDWPSGTPAEKAPDPGLGDAMISADRYTSREFMAREWDRIWTKVWLLGGRSVDIPEPGDYICTDIGKESVILVRQADRSIRGFYNVCLHRGNKLRPEGHGSTDEVFRCKYHHWAYDWSGKIACIPDLDTFPQGAPPEGRIPEIKCGEWGSFVWFTLNPDPEALEDYLAPIPLHLDPYHFERMAWTRDVTVEWDCNWKASVDAFNESYHVQGIHPQLKWYLDDVNIQIDCYERHNRYLIPFATISPRVPMPSQVPPALADLLRKTGLDPADYEGRVGEIRRAIQRHKREYGKAQGRDYSDLNDDQLTDDYHYTIFPNVSMNIHADDVMMFRQRPHPTDPDKMFYDIWMFELVPEGEEWPTRPRHQQFHHGDKTIGQVLDQDAFNLPTVQKGMHSSAFPGLWIGEQELRIRHFHHVISQYIYGHNHPDEGDI
jgi:phenylpropionate dioxygenase-like ring-hydroxylating dioxygenase large terminal subunit